jgi:hypothetical protein
MAQTRAVINLDINTGAAASHLRQLQAQLNAFTSSLGVAILLPSPLEAS